MKNKNLMFAHLLGLFAATACTDSGFYGSTPTKQTRPAGSDATGGPNSNSNNPNTSNTGNNPNGGTTSTPGGNTTNTLGPGTLTESGGGAAAANNGIKIDNGQACIAGPVDMNVMFLVDTTGSMNSQDEEVSRGIPAMLNQINGLKAQLGGKIRDTRLGFIGYIDQARTKNGMPLILPPTTDLVQAQSYITTNSHTGGDSSDTAEGGLWAFTTALDLLKRSATQTAGSINVVIVVTDAWSHDGGSCGADCRGPRRFTTTLADQLIGDQFFSSLLIFDWSPSDANVDGNGDFVDGTIGLYGSPMGQWQALRKRWQDLHMAPNSQAGAHLGDEINDGPNGLGQAITTLASQVKLCR